MSQLNRRAIWVVALLIVLSVSMVGAKGVTVRIDAEQSKRLQELNITPRHQLDYGSYRLLELEADDLQRLERAGVQAAVVADSGQIRVNGYHFDPLLDGEPEIEGDMRAPDGEHVGFRLIQFHGPVVGEWLSQLADSGLHILQYYPHHAYLVWGSGQQAETARGLGFVRWVGDLHPAYKVEKSLLLRTGVIRQVHIVVVDDGALPQTLEKIGATGAEILHTAPAQPDRVFQSVFVNLPAEKVEAIARIPAVLWLQYQSPEPVLDDEMSSQIVAGNHPGGVPELGYFGHLADLGYDGTGVIWSITDTGVDYDHPDLGSRIVGGHSYPGCETTNPGDDRADGGHGTHVAGITGGDATGGFTDGDGFLYGLGMAPGYSIFAQNPICGGRNSWPPSGGWQELSKQGVLGGAIGANNSWTSGEGTPHGYQATERTHDFMVRDGNFDTASVAEPYILVFSAGNSGPGSSTLTSPKEAKNLIVTAGSQNYRVSGNIDAMYTSSSRGPAVDGRYVPTITTPGQQIASTRNDLGGSCGTAISGTNGLYSFCTGTSMAAPHTSGSVVLAAEWWRATQGGGDPSPAMAKALLVNNAVDMASADVPNFNEGWGRINITDVIEPANPTFYDDQEVVFDTAGETWTQQVPIVDPSQPFKVTVAWSDAPGAIGANPALVNDLDLEVTVGGTTYLGNSFTGGWSTGGGSADNLNNIENVFIESPGSSFADITIRATAVNGDGVPYQGDTTDQDFAFVCSNCLEAPTFTLEVTPVAQTVCAPDDAVFDITVGSLLGYSESVTLSVSDAPSGATSTFSNNPVAPAGTSTLTIGSTAVAGSGTSLMTVTGTSASFVHDQLVELTILDGIPGTIGLTAPASGSVDQPVRPTFEWSAGSYGSVYRLEVATDEEFAQVVLDVAGILTTTYEAQTDLGTNTRYYWRVSASNLCGEGASSSVWSFITETVPGECRIGTSAVEQYRTGFETGADGWTHSGTQDTWQLVTNRSNNGQYSFRAEAVGSLSDQYLVSPTIDLSATPSTSLSFWSFQWIEDRLGGCADGGMAEISTNGGSNWTLLDPAPEIEPYDGPLDTDNPAFPSDAWCGDPRAWTKAVVDLSAYAGQTVQLRFRLATDSALGREGWYIDDVVVQSCEVDSPIFKDSFETGDTMMWSVTIPQ